MAALHALSFAEQTLIAFAPAPPPERRPGSLLARIEEVDCMIETIEALDLDDLTPELRQEFEHDLCRAIHGSKQKVDNTTAVLARFDAEEAAAAAAIARYTARLRRIERQRERLIDYVLAVLDATGKKKIEGETSTLSWRHNPRSVDIAEGTLLPARFMRPLRPPPPEPSKTAIREAIEAGEEVPGCQIVQRKRLVVS